jgi:hypothetical protein
MEAVLPGATGYVSARAGAKDAPCRAEGLADAGGLDSLYRPVHRPLDPGQDRRSRRAGQRGAKGVVRGAVATHVLAHGGIPPTDPLAPRYCRPGRGGHALVRPRGPPARHEPEGDEIPPPHRILGRQCVRERVAARRSAAETGSVSKSSAPTLAAIVASTAGKEQPIAASQGGEVPLGADQVALTAQRLSTKPRQNLYGRGET